MANKKKKRSGPPPAPVRHKARRPEPEGPTKRQQERTALLAAQARTLRRRKVLTAAVVLAVVAAVVGYVVLDRRAKADLRAVLTSGGCTVDTRSDPTGPAGQNHLPNPSFRVNPPAGGDHLASATRGGVYSGPSVPEDGVLVHSLEHGYVVVWHRPDLPAEQKERLEAFENKHQGDVIVTERASLPTAIAATAWGQRLLCQQVEPVPLERFFDEYVGQGTEDVPRG